MSISNIDISVCKYICICHGLDVCVCESVYMIGMYNVCMFSYMFEYIFNLVRPTKKYAYTKKNYGPLFFFIVRLGEPADHV